MIYYSLILLGVLTRLLPHLPNFTAVGAVALFSGYYSGNKKLALIVPLIIMFLSDWRLGFYQWQLMASVYFSFALVVLLGFVIRRRKWFWALPTSLLSTIIFFLVTNGAVWLFTAWYPHNFSGLVACYAAGLLFLKNGFLGDLTYTFALFAIAELARNFAEKTESNLGRLLGVNLKMNS